MTSSGTLDLADVVCRAERWTAQLIAGSKYEAASSMRLAAAKSMLVGIEAVFGSRSAGSGAERETSRQMSAIRQSILQVLIRALQDEDEDVRSLAGIAVATINAGTGTGTGTPPAALGSALLVPSVQDTRMLEQSYDLLCSEIFASVDNAVAVDTGNGGNVSGQLVEAWSLLLTLTLGCDPTIDPEPATGVDDVLFVKEDSNTFVEPLYDTQLAAKASYKLLTARQQHDADDQQGVHRQQQVCKALQTDPEAREALLAFAVQTAELCCASLLRDLSVDQSSVAASNLGGAGGDTSSGRCPTFLRMYRSVVGLAAAVFAVGAALFASDPDSITTAKIGDAVPLIAETVDLLRVRVEAGSIPATLRLAAFELRTACTAWAPKQSPASKAYAALLASQVAALATPGGTDEQQDFLRMLVTAVALEGDGEPVGVFAGEASPYESSDAAWDCPFNCSIPWSFLVL